MGTTDNVERLTNFYVEVMGFTKMPRPDFPFGGSWLQLGDIQLHVIERNPDWNAPEDPFNTNGRPRSGPRALTRGHHVAFLTDSIQEIILKLNHLGIEYYGGKVDQLWFYDPDGNGIEIMERRES